MSRYARTISADELHANVIATVRRFAVNAHRPDVTRIIEGERDRPLEVTLHSVMLQLIDDRAEAIRALQK